MSVQVKRRRESAAFLAGFVGAQGELLVDTTNNRVQVHDGATPGGFSAAKLSDLAGRNLIINGNFAINQRGYVSGANAANSAYMHDRWRSATSAGTSYTFTQPPGALDVATNAVDNVVTLAANTALWQIIDPINVVGGTYTLSQAGSALLQILYWDGSTYVLSAQATGMTSMVVPPGVTMIVQISATSSGRTASQVQLEPNAVATSFERRPLGIELILCQRFFQRWQQPPARGLSSGSTTVNRMGMPLPVPMRAAPSLTMNGNLPLFNGAVTLTLSLISTNFSTAQALEFDGVMNAAMSASVPVVVYQQGNTSLDLSAEF